MGSGTHPSQEKDPCPATHRRGREDNPHQHSDRLLGDNFHGNDKTAQWHRVGNPPPVFGKKGFENALSSPSICVTRNQRSGGGPGGSGPRPAPPLPRAHPRGGRMRFKKKSRHGDVLSPPPQNYKQPVVYAQMSGRISNRGNPDPGGGSRKRFGPVELLRGGSVGAKGRAFLGTVPRDSFGVEWVTRGRGKEFGRLTNSSSGAQPPSTSPHLTVRADSCVVFGNSGGASVTC